MDTTFLFEKIGFVLFALQGGGSDINDILLFIETHLNKKFMGNDNYSCSICLSDIKKGEEIQNNGCSHVFHKSCYYKWIHIKANCPCCRVNPFSFPDTLKN
jgi:hypothetical protein